MIYHLPAPDWRTTEWLNSPEPLTLSDLRGRVVMVGAFQMLFPGCVSRGLPQAQRVASLFAPAEVAMIGLNCVLEHHDAMWSIALHAFLHEYLIRFPVGIDEPNGQLQTHTMRNYGFEGALTTVLKDSKCHLRRQTLEHIPDLQLVHSAGGRVQ